MKIDKKTFYARRKELLGKIGNSVAILFNASEVTRNRDSNYKFRSDSYFQYFSGFPEANSIIFMLGGKEQKSIIFCQTKDKDKEIWNGHIYGPELAAKEFMFDEAYNLDQINEIATKLIGKFPKIYTVIDNNFSHQSTIHAWIDNNKKLKRSGYKSPEMIIDLASIVDPMRCVKSENEIGVMQHAADISSKAHIRAMQYSKPQLFEYQVEAELIHEFMINGAADPAYLSIVASGINGCTLHYIDNNSKMKNGDLILIDAGCEFDAYASDITRTFPVNGKFTPVQKDLYQLVLNSQKAAISKVKAGNSFLDPHNAALDTLIDGFIQLGLCQGTQAEVKENESYKEFFMHRTSHWLGMDVHDVGDYVDEDGKSIILENNNVLTIEPGCYIQPSEKIPKEFWGIGIRIEDDVRVKANSCEVLSHKAPKEVKEIESLVGSIYD